ncbi:TPA: hypothetical protein IVA69_20325 [Escherichia coli]|nr:hypothetical protein [Escherichia coli]
MPENPASYRVVRKKSYLFNKAPAHIPENSYPDEGAIYFLYVMCLTFLNAPVSKLAQNNF